MTIKWRQKLVFHNMIYEMFQIVKDSKTSFGQYINQLGTPMFQITTKSFYLFFLWYGLVFMQLSIKSLRNINRWYLKLTTLTNILTCKHEYPVQMNCNSVAQWVYQNATLLHLICTGSSYLQVWEKFWWEEIPVF